MHLFFKNVYFLQELCLEKEGLLAELQQLQDSTNDAVAHLQAENKQLAHDMSEMVRQLQEASREKTHLMTSKEKEKVQ